MILLIATLLSLNDGQSNEEIWQVRTAFNRHFEQAGVTGVFVAYETETLRYLTNDPERCRQMFIPASTFKIFHSLVALELGVLEDEDVTIDWDGVDRGWDKWNMDHNMRSAIKVSAVWFYQEVARRIGAARMLHYLEIVGYGNRELSGGIDLFWLEGGLRISPVQQIQFLRRLYDGDLPFSERNIEIVKDILKVEQTDKYVLSAKSGLASHFSPQVGWYVGYIQRGSNCLYFATQIDIVNRADRATRTTITRKILSDLGYLVTQ